MNRILRRVAIPAAIAVLAGACGGGTAGPSAAPASSAAATGSAAASAAAAPLTATMAVGNNMNHVVAFVGVEKGIFLKNGLDLKLKVVDTGVQMTKAMQAGESEFAGASITNTPLAREQGLPLVAVVGWMNDATTAQSDDPVSVVASQASGVGAGQFDKLAGKKVGLSIGGTGDEYLRHILKKKGVADSQVKFINVAPGDQVAALQNGSVDAIATWEPYGTWILQKVPGSVLVVRGGGYLGYVIMVSTTDDVVKKNPELVRRFVRGAAEAAQYVRQHRDESADISTRWIPGLPSDVARKAITYMPYDPRITKYTLQSYDDSVKILVDQKKLKTFVKASDSVSTTFIDALMKEQPSFFSDLKPVQ